MDKELVEVIALLESIDIALWFIFAVLLTMLLFKRMGGK